MDDLKGKEEHPWEASAEKPVKVDEMDRAPLLGRNFQQNVMSVEKKKWCRCAGAPGLSAVEFVFLLLMVGIMLPTLVWLVAMNLQDYQFESEPSTTAGQTSLNGLTDCLFHRSWIANVGRRGLPYSQTEACQITVVQEAAQKAQFSNNCCDDGRKILHKQPPNPETLKSLDFSDSDTNADDYPKPGPNPSPPDHDYPPPAVRSEMTPEADSDDVSDLVTKADDYPNPGPNPSPPDHDYPPPTSWSVAKPDLH